MQRPYWSSAWKKGGWIRLLFGMTLPHFRAEDGVVLWILSTLACPVSPTPWPGNRKAIKMSGIYGLNSSESSEKCSPPWCSSRMSQDSLPGFDLSERNYQRWVTSLRRDFLARLKSGPAITGNGCSSWRSPGTTDGEGGVMEMREGVDAHYKLRDDAAHWMTPTQRDYKQGGREHQLSPQVQEIEVLGPESSESGPSLPRRWPTATEGDSRSSGSRNLPGSQAHQGTSLTDAVGRKKLNPLFVEWLMGFPIGWTAFEPVEMQSYLSRQRGLLKALQESWG
jgi:hypothetical protein